MADVAVRVVLALVGLAVVTSALASAIITLVLPRGGNTRTAHAVTRGCRAVLTVGAGQGGSARRERALALLAPVALLAMPIAWLVEVWVGFAALFLAAGVADPWAALELSARPC